MVRIFKIYILPHLDFCAPLWNSLTKEEAEKIEKVQKKFTRIVAGCQDLNYEERLTVLELVPLTNRRQYLDLIQAYRLINKIDTLDHDLLIHNPNSRATRASQKSNVKEEHCKLDLRKKFFTSRAAKEWNELPSEVQRLRNIEDFKVKIRQLIFH